MLVATGFHFHFSFFIFHFIYFAMLLVLYMFIFTNSLVFATIVLRLLPCVKYQKVLLGKRSFCILLVL